jgi:hypothetical protein
MPLRRHAVTAGILTVLVAIAAGLAFCLFRDSNPRTVGAFSWSSGYKTVGFAILTLVVLLTAFFAAQRISTSAPRELRSRPGNISRDEVRRFTDFPLVSFGDEYGDDPLAAVIKTREAPWLGSDGREIELPGRYTIAFIYDRDCGLEGACFPDIEVHVSPLCAAPTPADMAPNVLDGTVEALASGALVQRFQDGHVRFWTGDLSIAVWVGGAIVDPAEVLEVLEPANDLGDEIAGTWPAPNPKEPCRVGLLPDPIERPVPDFSATPRTIPSAGEGD